MKELPITFKSNGKQIVGMLHLPDTKNAPVIVMCHGFMSHRIGSAGYHLVSSAREFCKNGYAILRFDYRGCGESEGGFEEFSDFSAVEDVKAAISFIQTIKEIDSGKIGLLGHSRGGVVASFASIEIEKIKCLVLWAPAVHVKKYWTLEEIEKVEKGELIYYKGLKIGKLLWESARKIEDLSKHIHKVKTPLLIVHGTNDEWNITAEEVRKVYKNANKPKKIEIISGADHFFLNKEKHRKQLMGTTVKWFKNWLK